MMKLKKTAQRNSIEFVIGLINDADCVADLFLIELHIERLCEYDPKAYPSLADLINGFKELASETQSDR